MERGNTVNDFQEDEFVIYLPTHLQLDVKANLTTKGEHGVVVRTNETTVFVRYQRNGMLQHTAEGTSPKDLWH